MNLLCSTSAGHSIVRTGQESKMELEVNAHGDFVRGHLDVKASIEGQDTPEVGAFYHCISSEGRVGKDDGRLPCFARPGNQVECMCKRYARGPDHAYLKTPSKDDVEEPTCCHSEPVQMDGFNSTKKIGAEDVPSPVANSGSVMCK